MQNAFPSPDASDELVLYFYRSCFFCQLVLRAIRKLDLDSKVELADIRESPAHRTRLLQETGKTQVPCLFINGSPYHESRDIVAWLHQFSAS